MINQQEPVIEQPPVPENIPLPELPQLNVNEEEKVEVIETSSLRITRSKKLPMGRGEKSVYDKLTTKCKDEFHGSSLSYD